MNDVITYWDKVLNDSTSDDCLDMNMNYKWWKHTTRIDINIIKVS